jgi:hypothetical protein
MNRKHLVLLLAVVVAVTLATPAYAAKNNKGGKKDKPGGSATPTEAEFLPHGGATGVSDDGDPYYKHNIGGVQCYFGVNGRDADLVTYNTGRTLHFVFDPAASSVAGLDSDFHAEVDIFAINYWGQYEAMGFGSTAQVQMDLEFYVGRITYELDYPSLAVMRLTSDMWLITSDPGDIPGDPGFTASSEADLNVIRRRKQETYATVNMPIRFYVRLQQ